MYPNDSYKPIARSLDSRTKRSTLRWTGDQLRRRRGGAGTHNHVRSRSPTRSRRSIIMLARPRRRWLGLTVMAETCALRQISLTPTFTASSRSSPGPFGALSSAREAQDSLPLVLLTLSLAHHCAASSSASSTRQVAAAPQRVNAPYPINPPPSPAPPAFLGPPALSTTDRKSVV